MDAKRIAKGLRTPLMVISIFFVIVDFCSDETNEHRDMGTVLISYSLNAAIIVDWLAGWSIYTRWLYSIICVLLTIFLVPHLIHTMNSKWVAGGFALGILLPYFFVATVGWTETKKAARENGQF